MRLPVGLKLSMDIFQHKMDGSFEGLPRVVAIVDDILVYGKTREEHNSNLKLVLQRALAKGNIDLMRISWKLGSVKLDTWSSFCLIEVYVWIPPKSQPLKTCYYQKLDQSLKLGLGW